MFKLGTISNPRRAGDSRPYREPPVRNYVGLLYQYILYQPIRATMCDADQSHRAAGRAIAGNSICQLRTYRV
jgi:hypothetical protein